MPRWKVPSPEAIPNLDSPQAAAVINRNFQKLFGIFADKIEVSDTAVTAGVSVTLSVIKSENFIVIPTLVSGTIDVAPEVTKATASFTIVASGNVIFDWLVLGV